MLNPQNFQGSPGPVQTWDQDFQRKKPWKMQNFGNGTKNLIPGMNSRGKIEEFGWKKFLALEKNGIWEGKMMGMREF